MAPIAKPKFPFTTIVEVNWRDAATRGGWYDSNDYRKMESALCQSVGFLIKKSKTEVVVGLTQCNDDMLNQCIVIPASWIMSVKVLRGKALDNSRKKAVSSSRRKKP